MYYTTKKQGALDKDYILVKHPLNIGGNYFLMGVKFVNGIAVVERGSKVHKNLLRSPLLKNRKEFGLEWLVKFGFRTKDVQMVFGKDIYYSYLKAIEKEKTKQAEIDSIVKEAMEAIPTQLEELTLEEVSSEPNPIEDVIEEAPTMSLDDIIAAHKVLHQCILVKEDETVCDKPVSKGSPSGLYCFAHMRKDPEYKKKLEE